MRFELKRPCKGCPFRTDCGGYLTKARAREIAKAIECEGRTFACHKTTVACAVDDGFEDMEATKDSQHCAGALIMLEASGKAIGNQMLRIAERLGIYDHKGLDMNAPVVRSSSEFVNLHGGTHGRKP